MINPATTEAAALSNAQKRALMLLNARGAKHGRMPRGTRDNTVKSLRRAGLVERI